MLQQLPEHDFKVTQLKCAHVWKWIVCYASKELDFGGTAKGEDMCPAVSE